MTEPDIFPRDIAMAEIKRRLLEHDELVPEVARLEDINADLLAALEALVNSREAAMSPEENDLMWRTAREVAAKAKGVKE